MIITISLAQGAAPDGQEEGPGEAAFGHRRFRQHRDSLQAIKRAPSRRRDCAGPARGHAGPGQRRGAAVRLPEQLLSNRHQRAAGRRHPQISAGLPLWNTRRWTRSRSTSNRKRLSVVVRRGDEDFLITKGEAESMFWHLRHGQHRRGGATVRRKPGARRRRRP